MDGPEGRGPQDAPGRVPERLRAAAGEGAGFGREAEVGAVLAALRGARPALPTAAVLRLVPEARERVGAPAAAAAEEADQRYRLFGAVRAILARWSEESPLLDLQGGPAPVAPRSGGAEARCSTRRRARPTASGSPGSTRRSRKPSAFTTSSGWRVPATSGSSSAVSWRPRSAYGYVCSIVRDEHEAEDPPSRSSRSC